MFSEMRRLLAPPSPQSEEDYVEEEGGDSQDSVVTDERAEESVRNDIETEGRKYASLGQDIGHDSQRDMHDDTSADGVYMKGISIPASESAPQSSYSSGGTDSGSRLAACRTGIVHGDLSSLGDARAQSGHDSEAHMFMDDLDALLRF